MSYKITPNNYVESEVRKEVVQRLIDFFMEHNGLSSQITINGRYGTFRGLKREIESNRDRIWTYCDSAPSLYDNRVEVQQNEMEEFCRVWVENGYFISRAYDRWGYPQYVFTKSPYTKYDFKLVTEFKDKL